MRSDYHSHLESDGICLTLSSDAHQPDDVGCLVLAVWVC